MANDKGNAARAMAAAPLAESTAVKPEVVTVADDDVALGKMPLPTAVFELIANPKTYKDRQDESKSVTKIAHVALSSGAFDLQASIYLETKVVQTSDGRHENKALVFSLPKGAKLRAMIPNDRIGVWKDRIVRDFDVWRKAHGATDLSAAKVAAGRLTL